jgi:hypothetical protein
LEPNILRSKLELSTVNEETNDSSFNNFPNKNEKKNYKNKDIIINDFVGNR